ncbi:228137d0-fe44-49a9-a324-6907ed8e7fe4 [Sclerotinia trifoliorum]|uniref:228137d0-fe44-49a9-a324-6907ed8e7fe4 n=1 Tax=Sclerotinia trifoliorum TaxID=28548 RepID=A0A8H2VU73_9HELO|nr:228137d0-fe44-49a9-a324-6907ed8e7fe4 [Sclerotinia trifoliorum]
MKCYKYFQCSSFFLIHTINTFNLKATSRINIFNKANQLSRNNSNMSTYNNGDSYSSTGRQGAPSSADDSFANTTGGFGNGSRGDTTDTRDLTGTGSTFDDQESSAYGGSSTQESRGFNTGNSGGLKDNEFGSSNSKYGGDLGDERNNFGTGSSDRSYEGNTGSGLGGDTSSGFDNTSTSRSGYGDTTSSGFDNTSTSRSGYGDTTSSGLGESGTGGATGSGYGDNTSSGYGDKTSGYRDTSSGIGGNTDSYETNKAGSGNTYGSDDQYSSGNTGSSGYDNTSSNNTGKSGDSTMGKVMEKAGNMLHKESLVQKGAEKRAAAGNDNY